MFWNIKIGDKIIVCSDMDSPDSMRELTVKDYDKDTIKTEEAGVMYRAFCWPIEAKCRLRDILIRRQAAKMVFDDLMGEVFKLSNEVR